MSYENVLFLWADMLHVYGTSEFFTGPVLFVLLLSVLFLLIPVIYLILALRNREVFERLK